MTLDHDTYTTLEYLEGVDDAELVKVHKRSASLLRYLMAAGYVENAGPGRMKIAKLGREALKEHRQQS
ncbi:hypothetical protein FE633_17625 [Streptomyces montanus]|uniref:Uncharacterized protein n=1 Tax=Streptomyces montanus TaxID=2580423 RepID=A0A5R9FNP3_9ACTN|nr:hypothetical protein [Streptomyces montanus]TLS44961.1 hypothetical protein FE633_17625 [Streptomyces montanus]